MNVAGRAALVTGGARGIGAAIATRLEAAGATVVVADREDAPVLVDLSQPGAAERMVAESLELLGRLDVLVNNAGGYTAPLFPENEAWRAPLELNLGSVMEATRAALPALGEQRGCIVNIASSAALGTDRYAGVEYAVAKAGVIRLTTALGTIQGVRVNCLCPHTVATESVLRALERRPLQEIAPPPATILDLDDVSAGVLRLIEDDSLSGEVLVLVGGEPPRFLE